MSGVYKRNKKETSFEPVDNAAKLQDEITKYIMNENRVPKRWRPIAFKAAEKAGEIADLAIAANETWPDEKHIEKRREYWRDCIRACKQLDRKLTSLQNCIPSVTAGSLNEILRMLDKEINAATYRKNNERVITGGYKKK